jgi:hypothetical protein
MSDGAGGGGGGGGGVGFGGGGGGSSFVTAAATNVSSRPSSRSGDGQVTITYVADADLALSQPANLGADATSPAGATVTYALPAVIDEDAIKPTPSCIPAPGSTIPIGTTTVTCTVTDSDDTNSPVRTIFTVHVKGAAEQLSDLLTAVQGVGPGTSLAGKVQQAQTSLAAGDVADTCGTLGGFIHEVQAQAGKSISNAQAQQLVDMATRIQAVVGCG